MSRLIVAVMGGGIVLLLSDLQRLEYTYNPWLISSLTFVVTLVIYELILRRLPAPNSWAQKLIGSVLNGAGFGLLFLALVILGAFVGNSLPGNSGIKIVNTMSQIRFLATSMAIIYSISYFTASIIVRTNSKQDESL